MAELKFIDKMSKDCRSYKILAELDSEGKITVLPQKVSDEIERNLEKKFIQIREEYIARERKARSNDRIQIRRH
jgi:hypothetical protein